ncbi:thioredoxin fold domain-containing protein [bacterium]|nr:thioredoxin fold domain-containing protein [bacterium]
MTKILFIIAGAAIGGALGYFGKCSTGTCPFTSTWWGAAALGAVFGLLLSNFFAGVPKTPEDVTNVIDINSTAEFETAIRNAGDKSIIADFYLTTCPPCRKLMPELYALARKHPDKIVVLKINASKNRELSTKYAIQAVPALFHIKNGETVSKSQGYKSADNLENWIK